MVDDVFGESQLKLSIRRYCGKFAFLTYYSVFLLKIYGTMAYTISNTIIKNPTKNCVDRLRKIGEEKAKRLSRIQERWEKGEYKNAEIIHVK